MSSDQAELERIKLARARPPDFVTAPPGGVHEYLSTACFHGDHDYCNSMTGYNGVKRPGVCKFCDAKCTCFCHWGPSDG